MMWYANEGQKVIHEALMDQLEKQGNPINWSRLETVMYHVTERYKHYRIHPSEMAGEVSHAEARADVFEVLRKMMDRGSVV